MEVTVFDHPDALGDEAATWDRLTAETGADICLSLPWLSVWAAHYADGRALRLMLMKDAGEPVAALPFVLTRHRFPVPATVATWPGAQETIPVFRPSIRPGHERAALDAALGHLFGEGVDAVSLTPLSGEDEALADAARALAADGTAGGTVTLAADESTTPHTIFTLPDSLDDWLKSLDKKRRSNWRRDLRLIEAETGCEARTVRGAEALEAFDRFAAMHGAQWRAAGLPGHFGDWPGALAFNRALVERFASPDTPGEAEFHEILDRDGQVISSQYVFTFGASAYWRLPARLPGADYDRLGLGRVGLGLMIGALADAGLSRIEAGPGHYDYKVKHGGVEHGLRRLVLARPGAAARIGRLMAWARALHLGYHRAWYARGALKLAALTGRPRAPVARAWLRTRL